MHIWVIGRHYPGILQKDKYSINKQLITKYFMMTCLSSFKYKCIMIAIQQTLKFVLHVNVKNKCTTVALNKFKK